MGLRWNFLAAIVLASTACGRDPGAPVKGVNPPVVPEIVAGPILSKQNFQVAQKEGYRVEVWTDSSIGLPIKPGFRIELPADKEDLPPDATVKISLTKKKDPSVSRESIVVSPVLKRTVLDGGYWENIRTNKIDSVDRPEKFVGKERVWEVVLDDPLQTDVTKAGYWIPPPGSYTLTLNISVKAGPAFTFNLPYWRVLKGSVKFDD
jgi:hypothetical protein